MNQPALIYIVHYRILINRRCRLHSSDLECLDKESFIQSNTVFHRWLWLMMINEDEIFNMNDTHKEFYWNIYFDTDEPH